MTTNRSIRTAAGIKRIELSNDNLAHLQIRDLLREHREMLIDRLIADLKTYINYKFSNGVSVSKDQLEKIKDKLVELKISNIDLSRYSSIVDEVMTNDLTHVKSELFYQEINTTINDELNPSQLRLVK